MSLVSCPECAKKVSDKADFCPSCGSKEIPKAAETPNPEPTRWWHYAIVLCFFGSCGFCINHISNLEEPPAGASKSWTWVVANIREEPTTNSKIIGTTSIDRPVFIKDKKNNWWTVVSKQNDPIGYISNTVLKSRQLPDLRDYARACQDLIRLQLKAPSQAIFPDVDEMKVARNTNNIGQVYFNSYVDAQNGFGAMSRLRYEAIVEYAYVDDDYDFVLIYFKEM